MKPGWAGARGVCLAKGHGCLTAPKPGTLGPVCLASWYPPTNPALCLFPRVSC